MLFLWGGRGMCGRKFSGSLRTYGLVIMATGLIVVTWLALPSDWGEHPPFSLFLLVVGAAGLLDGFWPGMFAVVLGAIAAWYFGKPRFAWTLSHRSDVVFLCIFAITGPLAALVCARLRRALAESQTQREELRLSHLESTRRAREEQARLEQEVAARTAELREVLAERERLLEERRDMLEREHAARLEAERANILKDEFVATASHELRTPLNAVQGWAQLLDQPEVSPEKLARGLTVISRNVQVLAQLVSDLLDTSRIITGKLHIHVERVSLPHIVEAALDGLRDAVQAKRIALHVMLESVEVMADPCRLQQVIWNLVSNAIKFTPEGGRVDVSTVSCEGLVTLQVRDTGRGIDPAFLPYIFDRFRQADMSTSREAGGLGLGLAIVKHIVELHGGTVRATSDGLGLGGVFTVTLPAAPASSVETHAARRAVPDLTGVSVLVVDDQPNARELAQRILEDRGASVVVARSAREAIDVCAARRPDVLVSAIGMPEMSGYELVGQLRDVPAVALTAYARPEDRKRVLEAGFREHVAKPIDAATLIAAVATCARL
jgi:signal transduction histidine kinase